MSKLLFNFAISIAACVCFYMLKDKKFNIKNIFWVAYLLILAVTSYLFFSKLIGSITNPAVWDFPAFYLYGKVAASGYNFYMPENFHQVYNSLHFPASYYNELANEVLDVGFPYPPPTILYFAPLGFLSYDTALVSWTIFNLFFVVGCIYLIYDQFLRTEKLNGILLIVALFFLFSPVRTTIIFNQTNFILLFYLLLIKKYSDKKISGIFLALAIFTKPYMIIIGLFFLLKRNWGAIVYSILSAAAICGLTLLFFGKSPFLSYIYSSPALRIPKWVFLEKINQSLHGVLLRAQLITHDNPAVYLSIATGILLLAGVYLLMIMKRRLYDYILPILLLVGLLLYPGTLSYYAVLLLFILFQFFNPKSQLGFNSYWHILIIGVIYALSIFHVFWCICILLIVLVLKSLNQTHTAIPVKAEPV